MALAMSQRPEIVAGYIYGDKDVFLFSWLLAEASYALVPHPPGQGDRGLLQRDFDATVLFQHRTGYKFAYATDEPPTDGFQHLEACNAALATLRQRWNGRVFWPPDRSVAARAMEAALVHQGRFRLEVVDSEAVELELLPFGEIGSGRSTYRQNWWCEAPDGNHPELLLRDGERVTYRLRPQPDGTFQGERRLHGVATVTLAAHTPPAERAPSPGLADQLLSAIGYPDADAAEWDRFAAAIVLLSRVDPAVLARLEEIAEAMPPEPAARLAALAARVRASRAVRPVRAPLGTLKTFYKRLDGDDPA
jgi:hypothetical protein